MKNIAIVGFGRFGQTLKKLLGNDFELIIINRNNPSDIAKADVVFYCVPISSFESVIKSHKKYFKDYHLLIDVLSVKMHPKKIFEKYLKGLKTQALLTHPMFGPDSSKNGFNTLPIIIDKFKTSEKNYIFWKDFFVKKGLKVIDMTSQRHDQLAANSQGLTHFVGRLLEKFELKPTEIDSLGAKKLQEVMGQTCNDTWQLFSDLQNFNPYTKAMRIKLGRTYDLLYNQLLPKRIDRKKIIFGIQGGKGSFNEEAVIFYINKNKIKKFQIKYLFTSEKVLKNLHEGNIDYGLFAIQNAVGGVVEESTHAMARYKFKIVEEFQILISHFLMKRKDVGVKQIKTIMAHSQNFRQCKNNLEKKYLNLKQISGNGDLLDTARCAEALTKNKIDKNTAILGPKILAEIYELEIIAENLQDSQNNLTTFFLVSR
ncbi:MAG: prephenate dehydrogenase/arogenate dehydrogenase family protein [Patescibacteria group bacterium]|jgi:prephenate dehydrogenase